MPVDGDFFQDYMQLVLQAELTGDPTIPMQIEELINKWAIRVRAHMKASPPTCETLSTHMSGMSSMLMAIGALKQNLLAPFDFSAQTMAAAEALRVARVDIKQAWLDELENVCNFNACTAQREFELGNYAVPRWPMYSNSNWTAGHLAT